MIAGAPNTIMIPTILAKSIFSSSEALLMITVIFLLADQVKESTNDSIVYEDTQEYQNAVKGAHKDKVNRVAYPVKTKWKHGKSPSYSGFSSLS
jgi:hypothetical protein